MTQERGIGKAETVLCFYRFGKAWTIAADRGGKKHPAFSLRCRRQNRFCGTAAQALRTQARFSAPPLLGWVYKHFSPLQSQKCETSSTFEIGAFFKSAVLQAGGRGLFTQNTRSFSDSAHPPRRFAGDTVLSIPPRAARDGAPRARGAALCSRHSFFLRAKALILSSECGIIKIERKAVPPRTASPPGAGRLWNQFRFCTRAAENAPPRRSIPVSRRKARPMMEEKECPVC